MRIECCAERAADKRRNDLHVFGFKTETFDKMILNILDALRFIEHRQFFAFPESDRAVQLHRIVMFDWNRVFGFDLDRRILQSFLRITAFFRFAENFRFDFN